MLIGPVASRMLQTVIVCACVRAEATAADAMRATPSSPRATKPFDPRTRAALRSAWNISISFVFGFTRGGRLCGFDCCHLLSAASLSIDTAQLATPNLSGDRERKLVDEFDVPRVL